MLLCTHELPVCKLNHLFCYLHLLLEPLKSRDGKLTDNMYFYFYYDGFVINFSSFKKKKKKGTFHSGHMFKLPSQNGICPSFW